VAIMAMKKKQAKKIIAKAFSSLSEEQRSNLRWHAMMRTNILCGKNSDDFVIKKSHKLWWAAAPCQLACHKHIYDLNSRTAKANEIFCRFKDSYSAALASLKQKDVREIMAAC
jgi:hypothetical protein